MKHREVARVSGSQVRAWVVDEGPQIRIEIENDCCILNAKLKRIFPLSAPEQLYSLQTVDDDEVAILNGLEGADEQTQKVLGAELDRRYYSPRITRIVGLKNIPGMITFDVETNRGPVTFFVRNWRDSSYEIEPNRWHITSIDGQRFEIPDLDKLDRRSQTLVEQLL